MEAMRSFFSRPVQPASTTTPSDTETPHSSSSTTPTPTITTATATATITTTTTHQPTDHPRDLLSDSEISALDLGPSVMDNTIDNTKSSGKNEPLPEVKVTPPSESDSATPVASASASSLRGPKNESHEHVDKLGVKEGEGVTGSVSASENTPPSSSTSSRNGNGSGPGEGKKSRGRGGAVGLVFRTISSPLLSPLRGSMNGSSSASSSSGVPVEGWGRGSSRPGVNRARTSFRWRKESES